MKKLLMIAFPFPPFGVGETIRAMKFIKYLPRNGWDPIVLTLASSKMVDFSEFKHLTVYRVPFLKENQTEEANKASTTKIPYPLLSLIKWFAIPDSLMWWIPFAVNAGMKIAKEKNIDAIYSVSPNHSCHIVAMLVSKNLGIPWVADFKDPWTTNPFEKYPTTLHKKLNFILESKVFDSANKIITVSDPIREDFISRHQKNANKISVITNGFDYDDFKFIKSRKKRKDKIIITHAGSLYGPRNPTTFLQAIKMVKNSNLELAKRIKIVFVGKSDVDINLLAKELGIEDCVECIQPVPYEESLQYQVNSDILLLIPGPGKGTVTGKVFEYMAIGKPIIALTDNDSFVARILKKTNIAFIIEFDNVNEISNVVRNVCELVLKGNLPKPNKKEINKYDRESLTEKLANILNKL